MWLFIILYNPLSAIIVHLFSIYCNLLMEYSGDGLVICDCRNGTEIGLINEEYEVPLYIHRQYFTNKLLLLLIVEIVQNNIISLCVCVCV